MFSEIDETIFNLWFQHRQLDVIFDCAGSNGPSYKDALKRWDNATFVSLNTPLLASTDKDGLICGILNSAKTLLEENILSFSTQGNTHRWGYFMPNPTALRTITKYVESGQVFVLYIFISGQNQ